MCLCAFLSQSLHSERFGESIAGTEAHNDWDLQGKAGVFCRNSATTVSVCRSHSVQLTSLILLSQAFYLHIFLSVCLFSLNLFTYTELKVFLEMLVWLLNCKSDSQRIINSKILASLFLVKKVVDILWFSWKIFPPECACLHSHPHRLTHICKCRHFPLLLELLSSRAAHLTCTINPFCYVSPLFMFKSKTAFEVGGAHPIGFCPHLKLPELLAQSRHMQTARKICGPC